MKGESPLAIICGFSLAVAGLKCNIDSRAIAGGVDRCFEPCNVQQAERCPE